MPIGPVPVAVGEPMAVSAPVVASIVYAPTLFRFGLLTYRNLPGNSRPLVAQC